MDNPYAASPSDPSLQSHAGVTPAMVEALRATKPWIRFCAILGFICTGFIFLAALFMGLGGGVMATSLGSSSSSGGAMPFAAMSAVFSIVYVLMGLLYLFPSIKLWKYGSRIAELMSSQSSQDLEAALDAQRSFWKLVGILLAVFIALYIAVIGVVVVMGVFGAAMTP
ncbi:DUF5362 family protein [Haloferula rosea]|uniref:DUF5362 domain-containing protein n=1 Tax=Haloferula rosea TaxID=490093 RepID=A0A934VEY0_9BACT|nr:DUF5362 family protein [Haloferula rosea]MBK1825995.1 hypothetical protein [Haloferula rosea]